MLEHRSLKLPITIGVTMIVLLIILIVGWVLVTAFGAIGEAGSAPFFWTILSVSIFFLAVVLSGVVFYLILAIKAINLNRRQSNFIDSVTHELKSPIASLKLCLQTLTRHQVDAQKRDGFHTIMLDDVERLDELISHLLDAGALEKKPAETEAEWIKLPALLADAAEAVRSSHQLDEAAISTQAPECEIHARHVDLDVMFRNLMDNAVKYGGQPPHVAITGELIDDGLVSVRIQDNGRGIPLEQRRRIFRRFTRLGSELEREKPGTGLGLYIVRNLVRRLRGKIHVHDAPTGSGSVFEVQLPAQPVVSTASRRTAETPRRESVADQALQ